VADADDAGGGFAAGPLGLGDADLAVIDGDAHLGLEGRFYVSDSLFGGYSVVGEDVDLLDFAARVGHDTGRYDTGEPPEKFFSVLQLCHVLPQRLQSSRIAHGILVPFHG
jgi:hypothetical protein